MKPELHDEVLERELRRRASGEWRPERILPAVRRGIQVRPQRVPAPRWAAVLGLVGVLGVLIVLAVALPRLPLGPSAASPTPEGSVTVLSAEDFAGRHESEELNGTTVLVEGRIDHGDRPGIECFRPSEPCPMGVLAGVSERVQIHAQGIATDNPDEASVYLYGEEPWPHWRMPEPPVEGILVLTVDRFGLVAFVGTVSDGDTQARAPDAVRGLVVESIAPDEVLIVDGWLARATLGEDCSLVAATDRVLGLPALGCGTGVWLGPSSPDPERGVRVQDETMYLVRGDMPVAEPVGGRYALARRLYGRGCADVPPCWGWRVVAVLFSEPPRSVPPDIATPATPRPSAPPDTFAPSPSPITAITCAPATRPDTEVADPLSVTVDDETGLVTGCTAISGVLEGIDVEGMGFDRSVVVRNSPGDTRRVAIVLGGLSLCDRNAAIGLRQSADRYQLTIELLDSYSICALVPVSQAVILELRRPLSADVIDARLTRPFDGSPSPSPAPATALSCPLVVDGPDPSSEGRPIDVTLTDNTGLVASCAAAFAPSPGRSVVALRNLEGNLSRLEVSWTVSSMCDYMPAELQLWKTERGYLVSVNQPDTGDRPLACFPAVGGQAVVLTLREPVPAEQLETMLMSDGVGQAAFEIEPFGEAITMTLQADRSEYAADEPIDIQAVLSYEGRPGEAVRLVGSTSGLVAFGARQLDGELAMGPGWDDACQEYDVMSGEPVMVPYVKSAGWSAADPNAVFYASWVQDPELTLPPGIWHMKAIGHFALEACGGRQVTLEASIVVTVR